MDLGNDVGETLRLSNYGDDFDDSHKRLSVKFKRTKSISNICRTVTLFRIFNFRLLSQQLISKQTKTETSKDSLISSATK
jgi:hypothetical protein